MASADDGMQVFLNRMTGSRAEPTSECRIEPARERLFKAAHCPSASGGRVPCCAKMRLATGPLPQTWLETRGLLIHGDRVRFTRGPPARVMKTVDTGNLH